MSNGKVEGIQSTEAQTTSRSVEPQRSELVEQVLRLEFPGRDAFDQLQRAFKAIYDAKGLAYEWQPHPQAPQVEARRARLLAASEDQLRSHCETLRERNAQSARSAEAERQKKREAAAAEKERKRFYNRPEAQPDFRVWAQLHHWTFEEALALLLGREPKVVTLKAVRAEIESTKMLLGPPMSQFLQDYERLRLIAERAPAMRGPELQPSAAVLWASTLLDFQVPGALVAALLEVVNARKPRAASSPAAPEATPAPPSGAGDPGPKTVVHSTKALRRDVLTPVIEQAQAACPDPFDVAAVWGRLQVMAENKAPPLIGSTEDGLQYLDQGEAAILNRKALGKRIARAKDRA